MTRVRAHWRCGGVALILSSRIRLIGLLLGYSENDPALSAFVISKTLAQRKDDSPHFFPVCSSAGARDNSPTAELRLVRTLVQTLQRGFDGSAAIPRRV